MAVQTADNRSELAPVGPDALTELGEGIRQEIEAAENAFQDAVAHAIRAGELLEPAVTRDRVDGAT